MALLYKVVETSIVTDDRLEEIINEKVREGWHFECIQFAMREGSKRPAMAFVLFTKEGPEPEENSAQEVREKK